MPEVNIGDTVSFTLENGDMVPAEDGNPGTIPATTAAIVTGVHEENDTVDLVIFLHSSTAPIAYGQYGRIYDKGGISYGAQPGEWQLAGTGPNAPKPPAGDKPSLPAGDKPGRG
jgi:hypothetical protein